MSDYIGKYKRRLRRSGNDVGDAYKNNTIAFIEATFHTSPTFRVLEVVSSQFPEIKKMDARVVEVERMGSLREIIFRPNQSLETGTYVKFDGDTWLLFDKYGGTGSTSVKMLAEKCNRTLKWKDKDGVIREWDCIAGSTDLGSKAKQNRVEIEWNKYDVRLPVGQLFVFVEANKETKSVEINQRFIFGNNVFEVVGRDDVTGITKSGNGIIQLTIKITTKQEHDDFENNIAVNEYKETGVNPKPPTTGGGTDDGGDIW
ncbi:hypothetical protein PQE74_gp195 [Bacillus phage vB_BanS_Chewbecca]|uniref:Uncharacterized protein n=2 Tax=Tsamsavirus TaxID=3044849 RepID=A0AAE8YTB2_9CAUD|nr:hypothetical protein PQE73_gp205 [Bacillus phage vB_BanS_MrDarsey]YP_010681338.1 hypothetical protein PQE74_gp195 [Bacillus phage vB_BanS_Chewbecca]UGO46278.1 hypothetical protein CHEWBECCA_195 [Bacillus phage vB_BanS_Chewbecca]UGO48037.1 hypothetical protein MRDARSEY_205 [Bacillus phage vB_BanS_MrDarsey]